MPPVITPFNPRVVTRNPSTGAAQGATDAREAQRAFFQQALGDTTPASAPSAPRAAVSTLAGRPAETTRIRSLLIPDEKPTRPTRPGTFVDVTV